MATKDAREIDRIRKRGRRYIKALQRDLSTAKKQAAEFIGPPSLSQTARIASLQNQIETFSQMVSGTMKRNVKQDKTRLETARKLEQMMGPTRRQNVSQRATRLAGIEINAASRGDQNALNATPEMVKAFYFATQNLWRTDTMRGKGGDAANINEAIVRATGKPLMQVWEEVMANESVQRALKAAGWNGDTTNPDFSNAPDVQQREGSPDWLMDIDDVYTSAGVLIHY